MGRFAAALGHLRAASAACGPDGPERVKLGFVSDLRAMLAAYQAWALLITGDVEAADRADRRPGPEVSHHGRWATVLRRRRAS